MNRISFFLKFEIICVAGKRKERGRPRTSKDVLDEGVCVFDVGTNLVACSDACFSLSNVTSFHQFSLLVHSFRNCFVFCTSVLALAIPLSPLDGVFRENAGPSR